MSADFKGRKYATIKNIKEGDRVQCDGDFTCIPANAIRIVRKSDEGLYIKCSEGEHYLDGQIKQHYYIGLYPIK